MYTGVFLHVCLCDDVKYPGTGNTDSFEAPCRPGPLEEPQALLIAEPSLQFLNNNLKCLFHMG